MMETESTGPKTTVELRKFGLTVGIAFAVLAGIAFWRQHPTPTKILGGISGFLIVFGVVFPKILGPVERFWMGFAKVLSKFTTPVFMSIVYFVVLAPVGLLRRTIGRNPMRHSATNDSFWVSRADSPASDLKRQF